MEGAGTARATRRARLKPSCTMNTSATMYFLSKDCFVCKMGYYWIVLSAKRDRYLCVAHDELASIGHRLYGWQHSIVGLAQSPQGDDANALIQSLASSDIITSNPTNGKAFAESKCEAPEDSVAMPAQFVPVRPPMFSICRFFLACGTVDWRLRTEPLSCTLTRIERRRRRAQSKAAVYNSSKPSRLVAEFKALRPLYPRAYLCFFDSLALLEFLATYNCYPKMVFGVVADPFQAHCWVQDGSTVFNDNLERVGRYKPILSV